jgi:chitinase
MMRRLLEKKAIFVGLLVLALIVTSLPHTTVFAARDRKAPSAPTNLHTTTVEETSVSLAWSASTDNVGVKAYDIYKDSKLIGSTTMTSYTVNSLTSGTSYSFYVRAKDVAGNISVSSNVLTVITKETIVTPPPTDPTPTTKTSTIVGYYAAWAAYSNYTPDMIDATKLTHINYAFANIGSDLKIALGYPDVDPTNIAKLNELKKVNPNLKTIISVGGWSWSGRFSDVALTDASRTAFADSCVDFIVKYGFDGVDIDWEYPVSGGLSTNVKRPEDKTNFTLLMKTLREKLDARGLTDGKKYLLTFAGACTNSYVNNTEMAKLAQYVDYANIMSYDIHGTWDTYTDFVAPLYTNTDVSPQYKYSVDAGVKAWISTGFPTSKIIMGVPFYGYQYNAVANVNKGLYQTYSGSASISYANIVGNYLNNPSFVRYFHPESMVPWLFNGTTFISYEDEQSIGIKADYINTKGLGGAMIWELSQDPNGVLLRALYNGLK